MNPFRFIIFFIPTFIYWLVTSIRNLFFNIGIFNSHSFDVPIIGVGNLSVGGTGKTPHVEYIISLLLNHKYKVAVLSRGYKRETKGYREAGFNYTPAELGDESCQMKNKFPDIILAVCESRVKGIKKLMEDH